MPVAELANGRIEISTDFTEKDLIRQVPGANWDPAAKLWHAPLSWGTCQVLRGVFGPRLLVGPQLEQWAWHERTCRVEPCLVLRAQVAQDGDAGLYPFQRVGVDFLATAEQALLADEMGTGKSVQTVRAVDACQQRNGDAYPVLVICPNSTKGHWRDHFTAWGDDPKIFVLDGSAAKRQKVLKEAAKSQRAVVIINWEAVRLHSRLAPYGSVRLKRCVACGGDDPRVKISACETHLKELNLIGFRTVVADEAHKQKDPKSKQTRAVWAVQHGKDVRYRFSLTGTPIANHPGDLWAVMHGIAPLDYPSKTRYVDRYALFAWNAFGGMDIIGVQPNTRDEFFRILDPRMRRMPKALVLDFLPPKIRPIRTSEMTPKQAKAYRELADGLITRLEDGQLVLATNSMTQALRLLQFSSSYAEVDPLTGRVHLSEPCSKVDVLLDILEELGDKPVAVCAESRQLIELTARRLEKIGISHRLIVGGMTSDQRDQSLRDFQEGRARVMLFTIKAGGVGLTMTAADTIVFLQRSWSLLDNKQAEDRVHRIGSEIHESISIIDVVAPGTIEEHQIARLREKMERLEEIVRDREALQLAGRTTELERLEAEEHRLLAYDLSGRDLLPAAGEPMIVDNEEDL